MTDEKRNNIGDIVSEMFNPKTFPRDLALLLLWLVLAILFIYIPGINETFIRVIFAVPVILFIPGYAFIAALFPKRYQKSEENDDEPDLKTDSTSRKDTKKQPKKGDSGIGGIERFALSVGLSIAIVPLIGLILNYTPFGIRLNPILVAISLFTVIMVIIALFRRARLPEDERFIVHFEKIRPAVKEEMFPEKQSKLDKVLSIILIVAIIAAIGTAVFVIAFPKDGEKFTEFYILGEDKMADKYPDRFYAGTPQFVWIGIGNHEYRNMTYTVDTILMNAEWNDATNSSIIHASMPLDRFTVPVADGTTLLEQYNFTVTDTGYNRLEFLLYNENIPPVTAPVQEKIDAAYRDLHLWINVI